MKQRSQNLNVNAPKRRILIVDDHPIFRQGIAQIIEHETDLEISAQAETAREALEILAQSLPDLVILDITLKGGNGLELMKRIKTMFPDLPVLILSMHDESFYAERALRAGARGYVMKQEASDQVMTAIRQILAGDLYVSPTMSAHLVEKVAGGVGLWDSSTVDALSNRELQVLELMGRGNGTRQIAAKLNVSIKTIETHRAHIKQKLGFKTAPEMVRFAVEWANRNVS